MIFISRQVNGGESFSTFDGMDEKTISDMFQKDDVSFEILTEQEYVARIEASPKITPPRGPTLEDRVAALEAKVNRLP